MTNPLQIQLDRIRRRLWLVLLVALIAVGAAAAASLTADTVYTGRAALTTASKSRSPDQDASLTQGYVQYFNEKSYQELIAQKVGVPPDVTFNARSAATSPILYIEASSTDRAVASDMAAKLAETFRDEVRGQLTATQDEVLADLRGQIQAAQARLETTQAPSDERVLILQQIFDLQERATDVQADTTNTLKDVQLNAGVSASAPNLVLNVALALVGGLILGCVLALALAIMENRLATAREVRGRLGLDTLAVVHGQGLVGPDSKRARQLKALANIVNLTQLDPPTTLAIATPRTTKVTSQVAEGLAYYRAVQGGRVLLLQGDLRRSRPAEFGRNRRGVAELLSGPVGTPLDPVRVTAGHSDLLVVPAGEAAGDAYSMFSPDRWAGLVGQATAIADLVVVDSPPLLDSAEGQVVCAAADRTLLVIEEGITRAADAIQACELLEQIGATVLGVVIARADPAEASSSMLTDFAQIESRAPEPTRNGARTNGSRPAPEALPASNGTPVNSSANSSAGVELNGSSRNLTMPTTQFPTSQLPTSNVVAPTPHPRPAPSPTPRPRTAVPTPYPRSPSMLERTPDRRGPRGEAEVAVDD